MLALVHPDCLHKVWPEIRAGLEATLAKCGDAHWMPEDIYTALKTNNAYLYTLPGGFLVLQRHEDPDGPALFVWIMYGDLMQHYPQIWAWLDGLATQIGAKRIRWHSPRRAYERLGGKRIASIYERDVNAP